MYRITKSGFHVTIESGDVSVRMQILNPAKVEMLWALVDAANSSEQRLIISELALIENQKMLSDALKEIAELQAALDSDGNEIYNLKPIKIIKYKMVKIEEEVERDDENNSLSL